MIKILSGLFVFIFLAGCFTEQKEQCKKIISEDSIPDYKMIGDSITKVVQGELLKNINSAIAEKGESYAVKFCYFKTIELTDSLSNKYKCQIRRVSLKNRNPDNEPFDSFEREQLEKFTLQQSQGEPLNDVVIKNEGDYFYFKPIFIFSPTCLKCHGKKGQDIALATEIKLYKYYPFDKATEYNLGDLRGMWTVKFLDSGNL